MAKDIITYPMFDGIVHVSYRECGIADFVVQKRIESINRFIFVFIIDKKKIDQTKDEQQRKKDSVFLSEKGCFDE